MLKINLYCVGSIKEKYLQDAINEYIKRLSKFAKVEIIEMNESKLQDNNIEATIKLEGENFLKRLKKEEYLMILDLHGKEIDSVEFSEEIKNLKDRGVSPINFFIGGTFGISDEVRKRANFKLSLSKMTFTHQFTRVLILEQIYRAFKIINNEQYHH